MKKTLYFEGAGCVPRGEVENCRIRTAFTLDNGEKAYLEFSGRETVAKNPYDKDFGDFVGFVNACFYITDTPNDGSYNRMPILKRLNNVNYYHENTMKDAKFEYTKSNILKIVNSLGCSFDEIVILHDLAGYRVFKDKGGYSFSDEFILNTKNLERAKEIYSFYYDLEKQEGSKYPNFSLWVDENDKDILHLLRSFPGKNKHWIIQCNIENWQESVTETKLNRYGC